MNNVMTKIEHPVSGERGDVDPQIPVKCTRD